MPDLLFFVSFQNTGLNVGNHKNRAVLYLLRPEKGVILGLYITIRDQSLYNINSSCWCDTLIPDNMSGPVYVAPIPGFRMEFHVRTESAVRRREVRVLVLSECINGLVQDCGIFITKGLDILHSYTKLPIWSYHTQLWVHCGLSHDVCFCLMIRILKIAMLWSKLFRICKAYISMMIQKTV